VTVTLEWSVVTRLPKLIFHGNLERGEFLGHGVARLIGEFKLCGVVGGDGDAIGCVGG